MLSHVIGVLPLYEKEACKYELENMNSYLKSVLRPELMSQLSAELNKLPSSLTGKEIIEDEDPPEHLSCPITLEIFKEPYIVSSGQTYEKDLILSHIKKNGNVDPLTRAKIANGTLLPNRALQQACQAWSKQHKP